MGGGSLLVRLGCVAACVAGVWLGGAVGCAPARPAPPDVVFVVVDTLRADRLGTYGNPRGLTPFLDELAMRGTRFANAYAASSWTNPSVASLWTSRYPSQHRVDRFESRLNDAEVTLAERLHGAGWSTAGFIGNLRLTRPLGFAQGFDRWAVTPSDKTATTDRLARRGMRWLARRWASSWWRRGSRRPVLFYFHCMEPHSPYSPRRAARERLGITTDLATRTAVNRKLVSLHWDSLDDGEVAILRDLYDGDVATLDARLRVLFAALAEQGVLDHALVVVTADHGEEFREHGWMAHGFTLYEPSIRVPLILLGPGIPAGRVVDQNVSLVDVAPTVLALLGLDAEPRFEGRSLVPLLAGAGGEPVDIVVELARASAIPPTAEHRAALVRGRAKLIARYDPSPTWLLNELYDLARDPGETDPVAPAVLPLAAELGSVLDRRTLALAERAGLPARAPVADEMRGRLRALGYAN